MILAEFRGMDRNQLSKRDFGQEKAIHGNLSMPLPNGLPDPDN